MSSRSRWIAGVLAAVLLAFLTHSGASLIVYALGDKVVASVDQCEPAPCRVSWTTADGTYHENVVVDGAGPDLHDDQALKIVAWGRWAAVDSPDRARKLWAGLAILLCANLAGIVQVWRRRPPVR